MDARTRTTSVAVEQSVRWKLIIVSCRAAKYLMQMVVAELRERTTYANPNVTHLEDIDFRVSVAEIGVRPPF